jgi:hypothetical protein
MCIGTSTGDPRKKTPKGCAFVTQIVDPSGKTQKSLRPHVPFKKKNADPKTVSPHPAIAHLEYPCAVTVSPQLAIPAFFKSLRK